MFWLVSVAVALWVLWSVRNDKIFNQKEASSKSCIFQAKLRSLIWLKTSNGKKVGDLDGLWDSPNNLGVVKFEWKRSAECTYNFMVAVAVIGRVWGVGGVLVTGKGVIHAIFSSPLLCCSMVVAEIEAIKLALLIFIDAGHSTKVSLVREISSQAVLNWIVNPLQRPWSCWKILAEIDDLTACCKSVSFSTRNFSGFENACWLARDGTGRSETFKAWW
ncbi:hypothetical protein GQ457_06G018430 [Hibiscus cannabinus]